MVLWCRLSWIPVSSLVNLVNCIHDVVFLELACFTDPFCCWLLVPSRHCLWTRTQTWFLVLIYFYFLFLVIFGWLFVKRFTLCYQTVVCPVCDVGLLWPNGWMDQDETWHAGRPRPWPHCVRWGPTSPSLKGAQPPVFGPYLLWPNGWMDQDATWYGDGPWPGHIVLDGDPAPSPKKGAQPPFFWPLLWPNGWMDQGGTWHGDRPRPIVLDGYPAPPPKRGASPIFGPCLLWPNG